MRKQIDTFQGIRAIAIIMIVFSHLFREIPQLESWGLGISGVSIFVMLSGFCVSYMHINDDDTKCWKIIMNMAG